MTSPSVPAKRFPDRDEIAAVRDECEPLEAGQSAETTRRIAGRAMARRDMGKLVFLDVVDRTRPDPGDLRGGEDRRDRRPPR